MKNTIALITVAASLAAHASFCATLPAEPAVTGDPGKIYAVSYSHEDLGYARNPYVLRTQNRLENLYLALGYCDQSADWPFDAQYRWQQEMSEPFMYFLSTCTPDQQAKLVRYVKEGRISIAASHATVLADRLNPESAARLFYVANRHLPDMLGIQPSRVAMIDDVIGIPWSLPIYCEAAQVPYLVLGHNTCAKCDELESAPVVKWVGPKGTGSVLTFGCTYNSGEMQNPEKGISNYVKESAKRITENYVPLRVNGHDFAITEIKTATAAKQWNETGSPKVQIATYDMYLDALSRRQTPAKTPTVNKTGPCQWMDQTASDAWLFGRARQAAERLPMAEKFSSFAMASVGAAYPWFDFTTAWHNLLSNYEHTIGASNWRCNNFKAGNSVFHDTALNGWRQYETELVEHREEGLLAKATADRTLDDALDRLCERIPVSAKSVAVFNSLGQPRTDVVHMTIQAVTLTDSVTGEVVPVQQMPDGTAVFIAKDVPALGYKVFTVKDRTGRPDPIDRTDRSAETQFYKLTLDPTTGTIASLFDKELGVELVKQQAPHAFNQYLYQWYPAASGKSSWSQPPVASEITIDNGPVAAVIRVRAKSEGVNWLEQTITLYHAVKRIDFAIRMDKRPSGRSLLDYATSNFRGKESVFVALPLDIPGFKAVYQTGGGGVAEPIKDYFTGAGTAFQAVQHFTDLSNDKFGVTISPLDCSLVEFGYPRSDALTRQRTRGESYFEKKMVYPKDSSIYMYLMNNMFTTNIRQDQRGEHLFRWSLRSHAGDWQAGKADLFGEAVNQPLQARTIPRVAMTADMAIRYKSHSFASVDADNVSVSTCKLAENNSDGFILRLVETRGLATSATLNLPFMGPNATVTETDLVEADLHGNALTVTGNSVKLSLPPFGVKTVRVGSAAVTADHTVRNLAATAQSDLEIGLTWDAVPGTAFYRVYRGTTAEFTPSALTLVATTAQPSCLDQARDPIHGWIINRLHPETSYFYRVEAVSVNNQRGPACAAVQAKTLATAQKACPPQAVRDLHAILVSPLAPANEIDLLWRSNVEPNIAAYEIHRSTDSGFTPSPQTLLAKQPVQTCAYATIYKGLDHQMFHDTNPAPATRYYYKVRAITTAGLAGAFSREASATSKARKDEDLNRAVDLRVKQSIDVPGQ